MLYHNINSPAALSRKQSFIFTLLHTGQLIIIADHCIICAVLNRGEKTMASSREYLDFVLDQLSSLDGISYKKMMGEFIIYLRGKIVGGIYDDMFLVKPVPSAIRLISELRFVSPYPGTKEMLVVDNIDDRDFLTELVGTMYDELPEPVKH